MQIYAIRTEGPSTKQRNPVLKKESGEFRTAWQGAKSKRRQVGCAYPMRTHDENRHYHKIRLSYAKIKYAFSILSEIL